MMQIHALLGFAFASAALLNAEDVSAQQTIQDTYTSSFAQMRAAKTKPDLERLLDSINAPEWVAEMPAGETLTREDAMKDGQSALAMPAEKRPIPKMQIAWIRETDWNVLVVYWQYRLAGHQTIGALYRDSWVRTKAGWRRIRTQKFFPDRVLVDDGKGVFLPD
jgi:hypothetical protein